MQKSRALVLATLAGTVLQVAMVVAGHFVPAVTRLFAVGGMGISFLAGVAYGWLALRAGSRRGMVLGAGVAGAVCGFLGILVSRVLGDVPASLLVLGTASSAVTGVLGGALVLLLIRLAARGVAGAAVLLLLAAAGGARAQEARPAVASAASVPAASTADFAWLAGTWRGELASGNGTAEVVYAPPAAGVLTGVLRIVVAGKVAMLELISLVDTPRGPELRFRHFSPELAAFEADFRQVFRLKTATAGEITFENAVPYQADLMSTQARTASYLRRSADDYVAHSDIIGQDGKPGVIEVSYRRVRGD